MRAINIETMSKHYIIAALWADAPEGTNPRATKAAEKQALGTCAYFAGLIAQHWPAILECKEYGSHPDAGSIEASLGHDLYLTSAGHGVGFWCRDELTEELREALASLCGWRKAIPEPEPHFYRGWMYL